ncbi:MAG: hypothetical protein H0W64_02590 [Gammaproteobacteria bacterium]|nr:hypothetical protein [Gammaproteobacteria bacterium]
MFRLPYTPPVRQEDNNRNDNNAVNHGTDFIKRTEELYNRIKSHLPSPSLRLLTRDELNAKLAKLPNAKQVLLFTLISFPPALEGIGKGALSLTKWLDAGESFGLFEPNPEFLKSPEKIIPLAVISSTLALAVYLASTHENYEHVRSERQNSLLGQQAEEHPQLRYKDLKNVIIKKSKNALQVMHMYPGHIVVVTGKSGAEVFFIITSFAWLMNQLGHLFKHNPMYYYSTIGLGAFIGAEGLFTEGPAMLKFSNRGYAINSYTDHIHNRFNKALVTGAVNTAALTTSLVALVLAMAESYESVEYILEQLKVKKDIAMAISWFGALPVGLSFAVVHHLVNNCTIKEFYASHVRQLTQDGTKAYFKNNFNLSKELRGKKGFGNILSWFVALNYFVIGLGAIDSLVYQMNLNRPTPVETDPKEEYEANDIPLYIRLPIYVPLAALFSMGMYAVHSRQLMKFLKCQLNSDNPRYQGEPPAHQGVTNYTAPKISRDALHLLLVFLAKASINLFYSPNAYEYVKDAQDIKNSNWDGFAVGTTSLLCYIFMRQYSSLQSVAQFKALTNASIQNESNEIINLPARESVQEVVPDTNRSVIPSYIPRHKRDLVINCLLLYGAMHLLTVGLQYGIKNVVLHNTSPTEMSDRNAIDQLLTAVIVAFASLFILQAMLKSAQAVRSGFNFFKTNGERSSQSGNHQRVEIIPEGEEDFFVGQPQPDERSTLLNK